MRQAPFRPDNTISQTYNSGVCTLYQQEDAARPGYRPRPELQRKAFLRYEEQRMGLTRYYTARQVDVEIERVIRVPKGPAASVPTPQDIVRTENGVFYRVYLIQTVPGVWPESLDLTLVRYIHKPSPLGEGTEKSEAGKILSVKAGAVPPSPEWESLPPASQTKGA